MTNVILKKSLICLLQVYKNQALYFTLESLKWDENAKTQQTTLKHVKYK